MIRSEAPSDLSRIRDLHQAAFGDMTVPNLVDALRSATPAPFKPLSFVADSDGEVVGHVMLSASRLDAPRKIVDVFVMSPLGIQPDFQRQGVGLALIRHAIDAANGVGVPLIFLEGNPRYYGPRGFRRASELGFRSPSLRIPDAAFQVLPLDSYEPWMTGSFVYSDTFWALDCVGLR